jgi:hypothetical protein
MINKPIPVFGFGFGNSPNSNTSRPPNVLKKIAFISGSLLSSVIAILAEVISCPLMAHVAD